MERKKEVEEEKFKYVLNLIYANTLINTCVQNLILQLLELSWSEGGTRKEH